MKRSTALLLIITFTACYSMSSAQSKVQSRGEHWVSTWATAQQLMPTSFPGSRGGAPPQGARGPQIQAPPAAVDPSASQGVITPYQQQRSVPVSIDDQTVRMIAHITLGSQTLRIEISNMANSELLEIGSAHIAVHKGAGAIIPDTDRVLKFSGNESTVVPPGALVVSDPVNLNVEPFSDLAISLYLPKNTGSPTNHTMGLHTAYISKGNVTGSEEIPEPTKTYSYLWLTGIDVLAPADSYAIVALGDSITDGFTTTVDANTAGDKAQTCRVQQTFLSPNDERLYGMAQCQDGVWDLRGMPIELRQVNTQAALPVLVSSRGYGLLWNNASLTDFNPIDQEIPLSSGGERIGKFTTGEAGEYVFFAKDGDRRNEIGIIVNGQTIAHLQNMWVPYTTTGKITLPARSTCSVRLLGGGKNARLFARPFGNTTVFRSQTADSIDYYFFYGPELDNVIAAYRAATGEAPMWPKWAYGFWQCRERYSGQQQILDTVAEFRERRIPIDLIVQDWQYWGSHGWGAYEWDASHYPDPEKLIQSLHRQNVHFMISVWSNPQGKIGVDLKAHNYVIPGTDWVDALNPAARKLRWKYLNDAFFKIGADAWWQDATEPGDDGNSMANNRVFLGSGDLYRNAYPLFANRTVYEGQRKTSQDKRVVILTRSAFPGQQRYATALWSGDIGGNWDALRRQIPAGLHVSLAGLPYWTTDCGGFFRPKDQYQSEDYADLLVRWFQFSTFCPVQRIHGFQSETEFWKFPRALDTLIAYDRLRYRLLPYIYSIAWRVTHAGYTMMRALPMDFRSDPNARDISDQYMFGPAFLVNPVVQPKTLTRSVYLPASAAWTNFWTGESSRGGGRADALAPQEVIPLFVRAGSIIPMGPDMQYANEKPADPIELRIYSGADGNFTLYEDEGDSYRYEKGVYATIPIQWKESSQTLIIGKRNGEFPGMLKERTFHILWVSIHHGVDIASTGPPDAVVQYKGDAVKISRSHASRKK